MKGKENREIHKWGYFRTNFGEDFAGFRSNAKFALDEDVAHVQSDWGIGENELRGLQRKIFNPKGRYLVQ